jgi:hypothetical protein
MIEIDAEVAESSIETRRIAPFRRNEGQWPLSTGVILGKRHEGIVKPGLSARVKATP